MEYFFYASQPFLHIKTEQNRTERIMRDNWDCCFISLEKFAFFGGFLNLYKFLIFNLKEHFISILAALRMDADAAWDFSMLFHAMPGKKRTRNILCCRQPSYERMTEWTAGRTEKRTSRDFYTVKVNGFRRIMIFAVYYSTNWQINNVVLSYLINCSGYLAADEQSNSIAGRLFVSNVIYLVLSNCDGFRLVLRSTRFVTCLAEIHSKTLSLHNVVSTFL